MVHIETCGTESSRKCETSIFCQKQEVYLLQLSRGKMVLEEISRLMIFKEIPFKSPFYLLDISFSNGCDPPAKIMFSFEFIGRGFLPGVVNQGFDPMFVVN